MLGVHSLRSSEIGSGSFRLGPSRMNTAFRSNEAVFRRDDALMNFL